MLGRGANDLREPLPRSKVSRLCRGRRAAQGRRYIAHASLLEIAQPDRRLVAMIEVSDAGVNPLARFHVFRSRQGRHRGIASVDMRKLIQ